MVSENTASVALPRQARIHRLLRMLWRDKFAAASAVYLVLLLVAAAVAPHFLGPAADNINLRLRNAPPMSGDDWAYILGADSLGRSILARLLVGARNTLSIAASAVALSLIVGALLGLIAGYVGGRVGSVIVGFGNVLMSFPSLLLALIVLYVLGNSVINVILILALTKVPLYLRLCRAEVLELRERMYVSAARALGASPSRLIWRHIAPMTVPSLMTVATLEFSAVMLTESSLSFLGLGLQAPSISWGLMVAEGQSYLATAWWLSFWPGLAITLTALATNLLAGWLRVLNDPTQRWRLEGHAP